MRTLIDQIDASLDRPLYFLSLFGALAIPDIDGALDADDGTANGARYAIWYDRWVKPQFGNMLRARLPPDVGMHLEEIESPMTGEACYRFRCSLLHQGTTQHDKSPYTRILFVEPGASSGTLHYNVFNHALNIDATLFCREVVAGAREWLDSVEETARFQANYDRFARRYPTGLAPYIVGVPVIT